MYCEGGRAIPCPLTESPRPGRCGLRPLPHQVDTAAGQRKLLALCSTAEGVGLPVLAAAMMYGLAQRELAPAAVCPPPLPAGEAGGS